jgi:two-component system nitrate/nitrite response regulator NarL
MPGAPAVTGNHAGFIHTRVETPAMSDYSIEAGKVIQPGKDKPLVRVLAADSTRMNSQMLADVLARDKRFLVLETQTAAADILAAAGSEKPDVVLLSALLENDPGLGFKVARQIRAAQPATRIVMLLDRSERSAAVEAFRGGASGIFCRSESLKFLPRCIACVHAGQVWANSGELKYLLDALAEAMPPRAAVGATALAILSRREQDVVRGVADGLSNREIAQQLNLTEHTVKNYLFRIFDKLGVSSRVEVVLYAFGLTGTVRLEATDQGSAAGLQTSTGRMRKGPIAARRQPGEANGKESRKALPL